LIPILFQERRTDHAAVRLAGRANARISGIILAVVVVAGILTAAGSASAARLGLRVESVGRLRARLVHYTRRGRVDFVLDGRIVRSTRGRVVSIVIPRRHGSGAPVQWHSLVVRRHGSRHVLAHARFATKSYTDPLADGGPSGQAMPIGDLPGWHQVFADDFSADPSVPVGRFSRCTHARSLMRSNCWRLPASVRAKWWAYPDGWKDTRGNGVYSPSKVVSIQNGVLNYYIHSVNGVHMVAALEPKIPGGVSNGGLKYGRYVVRFRAARLPGYKIAWLLWPDSGVWPQDGEIDFPEGNLNGDFYAFMHHLNATSGDQRFAYAARAGYASWHTAVINWMPSFCRFTLDGRIVGTARRDIPNTPMHWVLQAETVLGGAAPRDSTAGNIQIAWVTAYTPA
jgi:hypothetical protein